MVAGISTTSWGTNLNTKTRKSLKDIVASISPTGNQTRHLKVIYKFYFIRTH